MAAVNLPVVKNLSAIADSIPGWGGSLEKEMATHSSILAWEISWTEEPSRLQSKGSQTVRNYLVTKSSNLKVSSFGDLPILFPSVYQRQVFLKI